MSTAYESFFILEELWFKISGPYILVEVYLISFPVQHVRNERNKLKINRPKQKQIKDDHDKNQHLIYPVMLKNAVQLYLIMLSKKQYPATFQLQNS